VSFTETVKATKNGIADTTSERKHYDCSVIPILNFKGKTTICLKKGQFEKISALDYGEGNDPLGGSKIEGKRNGDFIAFLSTENCYPQKVRES